MQVERKKRKWGITIILVLMGACVGLIGLSAIINLFVPDHSRQPDNLSEYDLASIYETEHLRQQLGDQVFPGFGTQEIPTLVFNEGNAFLVGVSDPAPGWIKVPQELQRGEKWQLMPALEKFPGEVFYRTSYDPNQEPDAFTVRVGDTYVASLPSSEWFKLDLMNQFRKDLPAFLKPIFPYSLVASIFFPNTDTYLSMIQHESFHAFQAVWAQARFVQAEKDGFQWVEKYPWGNEPGIDAWQQELDILQTALKSETSEEARLLVQDFLELREKRRTMMLLSPELIHYENQREWVEGMARYAELETWRLASQDSGYQPVVEMKIDRKFKEYTTFETRWSREVDQITRMAEDVGDGRFYYSGMAQAYLLDRLLPSWKSMLVENPMLNLEDLLKQALSE